MYAFPNVHDPKTGSMANGMTLRDYFAAEALGSVTCWELSDSCNWNNADRSVWAYHQADAMLKARDE